MKNKIILISLLFLLIVFNIEAKKKKNVIAEKAEKYSKKIKANKEIYYGEFIAKIEGENLQDAISKAKEGALSDLASKIKSRVEVEVSSYMEERETSKENQYYDNYESKIGQQIKTYTSAVLLNIEYSEPFIDYPKEENVLIFAFINKQDYDEKVKKEIENKKNFVRELIIVADKYFSKEEFFNAIEKYFEAQNFLEEFFSFPIYDIIYLDKKKENYTIYIDDKLKNILTKLQISVSEDNLIFSAEGKILSYPQLYVQYINNGKKNYVARIPLKIEFVKGEGISQKMISGEYGETNLAIDYINPKYKEAIVKVMLDVEKMGLKKEENSNISINSLKIVFKRKKTIIITTKFLNGNLVSYPENLQEQIKTKLLQKKYNVIFKEASSVDKLRNEQLNADYFIFVEFKTEGGGSVGKFKNMFTKNCITYLFLYKLPQFSLEESDVLPTQKGFGSSPENAGWEAFGKASANLIRDFNKFLSKIK